MPLRSNVLGVSRKVGRYEVVSTAARKQQVDEVEPVWAKADSAKVFARTIKAHCHPRAGESVVTKSYSENESNQLRITNER